MRTLTRGQVGPMQLRAALDEMGVREGDPFVVCRPEDFVTDLGAARRSDGVTAQAAARIPGRKSKGFKVLRAVAAAGNRGLTAEEAVGVTGIEYRTLTPRIGELKRAGLVTVDGSTRPGSRGAAQQVLYATDKGLTLTSEWRDVGAA